jgi:hypothetical protein
LIPFKPYLSWKKILQLLRILNNPTGIVVSVIFEKLNIDKIFPRSPFGD